MRVGASVTTNTFFRMPQRRIFISQKNSLTPLFSAGYVLVIVGQPGLKNFEYHAGCTKKHSIYIAIGHAFSEKLYWESAAITRIMLPKSVPQGFDMHFPTIEDYVGHTPLVKLQRLPGETSNVILAKLEGNNPAGSVKDRPALGMIQEAERRGEIRPGDTLIEATSGNTGIALAMAAAIKGYKLVLIMPANMSEERRASMRAYGADIITVSQEEGMEAARDLALSMAAEGRGTVLDQFSNEDNPLSHYRTTAPEIWEQTQGRVTHFVSSMGTTGTIMGVSRYLKERNPDINIVGLQPKEGASIPGIRRWPEAYLPTIYDASRVDQVLDIGQQDAENTMRALAEKEGIFCGVSSGGSVAAALQLSKQVENAIIVAIICDRGDRYLSTGVFPGA